MSFDASWCVFDARPRRGLSAGVAPQARLARFSWAARRATLRAPVFLCTTPLDTARISSDSASTNAVLAAAASPPATASSNLRRKVRTRERRALLTSVRAAILRIAFLAPGLLAIGRTLENGQAQPGRANWRRGYTERRGCRQRCLGAFAASPAR